LTLLKFSPAHKNKAKMGRQHEPAGRKKPPGGCGLDRYAGLTQLSEQLRAGRREGDESS
jgi:hypothetical protein